MNQNTNPLVELLAGLVATAVPGHAGTIALLRTLFTAGTHLRDQIAAIKAKDPAAYAEIAKEFGEADDALTAALDRADARDAGG